MQYLSDEQREQIRGLKMQGYSRDEVTAYLVGESVGLPSSISMQRQQLPPQRMGVGDTAINAVGGTAAKVITDLPQDITALGRGVQSQAVNAATGIADSLTQGGLNPAQRFMGIGGSVVGGGLGLAGEAITGAARFGSTPAFEQKVAESLSQGVQAVANSETGQGITAWYDALPDDQKFTIERGILPALDAATAGIGGGVIGKTLRTGRTFMAQADNAAKAGAMAPAIKVVNASLDDAARTAEVDKLAQAFNDSLVENRMSINSNLQTLADESSFGDTKVTPDILIRNLAEEGVVPDVKGRLADFSKDVEYIKTRQTELMKSLEPVIAQTKETLSLDDLYQQANTRLINDPRIGSELTEAQSKLDRIFNSYRQKYPSGVLSASDVNSIKIEANQRRSDYKQSNASDPFITDAYAGLARTSNEWLNSVIPDQLFKQANAEYGKLQQVIDTAAILQNQQVDVGLIGRALGSYVTTVAGSTAGLSVGGPGGLVIAGILAKIGGDKVADMMRNVRFSPELRDKIRTTIANDAKLKAQLEKTASPENRRYLALPAATPGAPRSSVAATGKPTQVGGQTPTGRVQPGVTDRVAPGAIQRSDSTPTATFTEQALQSLKSVGVEPKDVQNALGAGLAGYLLMTYMDDNGVISETGLAVIGAVAATPGGRKAMAQQLRAHIKTLEKQALSTKDKPTLNRLQKAMESAEREARKLEAI